MCVYRLHNMAASNSVSHLYPIVRRTENGASKAHTDFEKEAKMDLLAAQEQLVQDVSSTAVLTRTDDDEDVEEDHQEPAERENWSGRFDFLMSLLGFSVGLGNVWRFPYLAYSNGGGAFLFPFILMFMLLGFPLMFLELSFGQFAALGPAAIFDRICPILSGLGLAMVSVSFMVSFYYTVIIGWAFLYLFKSFTSKLPWERCNPEWATDNCYSHTEAAECASTNGSVYYRHKCYNETEVSMSNISMVAQNKSERFPPAQDFFEHGVLSMSDGIDNLGSLRWQIALCLLLTWTLTFLALSRGVKSVGKVVYFTALFPYIVLTILFFRGITLDGSKDGILYYLTPRFHKLIEAKTWVSAAVQIFFALSPAWGGLITLSSYNKFNNDCFKDSLIVGVGNICTSFFAGLVIFSIIGYLAKELEMPIESVVEQGPGLAFIVFPDVVTRLPIPPLWSILFFFMLVTLGMGSEFALLETVMTAVQDTHPPLREKKVFVVLTVSLIGFLGGLVVCTEGGIYILQLMDTYAASWAIFIMAILECVIIAWIYGADVFIRDIEMMIGHKSRAWHIFFTFFWKFLSPATLLFLLFFNWIEYKPMSYDGKKYPILAELCGWFMASIPIFIIVTFGIWGFYRAPKEKTIKEKFRRMCLPTPKWGPANKIPKFDTAEIGNGKPRTVTNPGFSVVISPFETRI